MWGEDPPGTTPLEPEEIEQLIPGHVTTREQLNALEQANILEASRWVRSTRKDPLDEALVRELHERMFGQVWEWAGVYRHSDKNIGVPWPQVPGQVKRLLDDGRYWLEEEIFAPAEAVLRLHHRMVKVHPFPNGNGRHARLWCDLFLRRLHHPPIPWNEAAMGEAGDARERYLRALRAADDHDYGPLLRLYLPDRG